MSTEKKIQDLLTQATTPLPGEPFFNILKELHTSLHAGLTPSSDMLSWESLATAVAGDIRKQQILEFCGWSVFDKPLLPTDDETSLPEFLWLFVLPVVITWEPGMQPASWEVPANLFDAGVLLDVLEGGNFFNPKASLRSFSTFLQRSDIRSYGPKNFSICCIGAELGLMGLPAPKDLQFDTQIESCRTTHAYIPLAARLPVGEAVLYRETEEWAHQTVETLLRDALRADGQRVASVTCLAPCSYSESLLMCQGAGFRSLEANLQEASALYGPLAVIVKHPVKGYAEVTAVVSAGVEISLMPAFAYLEPQDMLVATVKAICQKHGIGYKGTFSLSPHCTHLH